MNGRSDVAAAETAGRTGITGSGAGSRRRTGWDGKVL